MIFRKTFSILLFFVLLSISWKSCEFQPMYGGPYGRYGGYGGYGPRHHHHHHHHHGPPPRLGLGILPPRPVIRRPVPIIIPTPVIVPKPVPIITPTIVG
uniref:Uncharacterized protein n=1 Tax=Strongyloides papillosus TaxID=174720 RepID=A0A0N5CFK0_STREA